MAALENAGLENVGKNMASVECSVRRRGKKHRLVVEVESLASSCKKITTRRREGVGVVVEKNEESRRTIKKIHVIYLQQ